MNTDHIAIPGPSVGTQHALTLMRFGKAGARPQVYIQAALHADEIPGMACAIVLRRRLESLEREGALRGEVVLVPVANPVGLAQAVLGSEIGRFDLASGVNFNREHAALGEALVERVRAALTMDRDKNTVLVRAALADLIAALPAQTPAEHLKKALLAMAAQADIVLDLHCDTEAVVHLYTTSHSAGTFAPLAARLRALAYLIADVSGGDPFDEALSRPWAELATAVPDKPVALGCHATTVELRGQNDVSSALAEADAAAILAFLQDVGVLAGQADPAPDALCEATPLAASEPIACPVGGVLTFRHDVGATLRAGEPVADVTDPISGAVTTIPSPCDGVLFARVMGRFTRPGRRLGKVAGRVAHRTGKLLGA